MNYFTKPYLSAICFLLLSLMLAFQAEVTANTANELRNTLFRPNTTSVTVTCQVTLNSGESPEGTFITLTGVNNPALYFEGVAPESGTVVFTGVTEANYRLNAVLEGYYELDTLITILSNRLIPVNLQEITHNPSNLTVDSVSLRAHWQPVPLQNRQWVSGQPDVKPMGNKSLAIGSPKGGAVSVNRSFTGYAVFLDGILQGNTFDTSFVFEPLVYGQSYLAGVAAVYTSGYSEVDTCRFTSGFLFPPQNLTAETWPLVDYSFLTWEAPENPQYPGQAVPGLTAYRIYRNQQLIAEVASDTTEFYDLNLPPARYSYEISAVYYLTSYGFPSQTGESMKTGPEEVHIIYGYELPFTENFNTGLFETYQWTVEGTNWRIAGQAGNPAPAVEFYFSPVQMDYSFSLTSFYLIGSDIIGGDIMLDFDLKLDDLNATGRDSLLVEILTEDSQFIVASFSNQGDIGWITHSVSITDYVKGHVFRLRLTAKGENSLDIYNWQIDNINVYRECAPPRDFSVLGGLFNYPGFELKWRPPMGHPTETWVKWDYGTNNGGFGLPTGGTFNVASRFGESQLEYLAGGNLTKIRIFPVSPNATLTLKVWKGYNGSSLVFSQPIDSYVAGEWNEFILSSPVQVDRNTLWIGYEVTHSGSDSVAGYDYGPVVSGMSDMISYDGIVWETVSSQSGLKFNWNIQGFIEKPEESKVYASNTSGSANFYNNDPKPEIRKHREIIGYNIYRDKTFIATTPDLFYFDNCFFIESTYYIEYDIKAIFEDCESELVNVTLWAEQPMCAVGVSYELTEDLKIYPNPSSGLIYVDTRDLSGSVQVYSFSGKLLLDRAVAKNEKPVLWLHDFPDGAYLVKFVSVTGETLIGKVLLKK